MGKRTESMETVMTKRISLVHCSQLRKIQDTGVALKGKIIFQQGWVEKDIICILCVF